ncbi:IspD/TarI family cytidylyltransferase [Pseudactinotalea sp.]|uniref:IspD/TarI family cytidylyltransferase n=1 Tax=Pseudactinotalea sp. TaxID=1926260 RepID=UPI003B3AF9DA
MRTVGIVVAAGSGTRLGHREPKALVHLAGRPLVWHAARRLVDAGCDQIIVSAPPDRIDDVAAAVFGPTNGAESPESAATPGALLGESAVGWTSSDDPQRHIEVGGTVCPGGPSRQESVVRALAAADPRKAEVVLVHDAARPLAPVAMIASVIDAVRAGAHAVIPGLPVADTIKRVRGDVVAETVDRAELVAVQTPQGFDFATLYRAHRAGRDLAADERTAVSDDAGLVERFLDVSVHVVPGDDRAMKVTTAADLALAEALLANGTWS